MSARCRSMWQELGGSRPLFGGCGWHDEMPSRPDGRRGLLGYVLILEAVPRGQARPGNSVEVRSSVTRRRLVARSSRCALPQTSLRRHWTSPQFGAPGLPPTGASAMRKRGEEYGWHP
jgi:hypothetical protein